MKKNKILILVLLILILVGCKKTNNNEIIKPNEYEEDEHLVDDKDIIVEEKENHLVTDEKEITLNNKKHKLYVKYYYDEIDKKTYVYMEVFLDNNSITNFRVLKMISNTDDMSIIKNEIDLTNDTYYIIKGIDKEYLAIKIETNTDEKNPYVLIANDEGRLVFDINLKLSGTKLLSDNYKNSKYYSNSEYNIFYIDEKNLYFLKEDCFNVNDNSEKISLQEFIISFDHDLISVSKGEIYVFENYGTKEHTCFNDKIMDIRQY